MAEKPILKILEQEKAKYKERLRDVAAARDERLRIDAEAAVGEAARTFGQKIETCVLDFSGESHKKRQGIIFQIQFVNGVSLVYKYADRSHKAYLYLTAPHTRGTVTFCPEHQQGLRTFRDVLGDDEDNTHNSTIEDRMLAKLWKNCSLPFAPMEVVHFAEAVFHLYVKLALLLDPKRESINAECFIPHVFETRMVEMHVCVKADLPLEAPPTYKERAPLLEQKQLQLQKEVPLRTTRGKPSEQTAKAIEDRIDEVHRTKEELMASKSRFLVLGTDAMRSFSDECAKLTKEIGELQKILWFITEDVVDTSDLSPKIIQDDDWLDTVNSNVLHDKSHESFKKWKKVISKQDREIEKKERAWAEEDARAAAEEAAALAMDVAAVVVKRRPRTMATSNAGASLKKRVAGGAATLRVPK